MIAVHDDLLAVLDAVCIESRSRYRVLAETREIVDQGADSLSAERPQRLVDALADDIYAKLYCRPAAAYAVPPFDELSRRDHMLAISAANCGRGTWEAGWTVRRLDADGRVTVAKGEVNFGAPVAGVQPSMGQIVPGGPCRIWVPKELRCLVPGFYMALGDGNDEAEHADLVDGPLLRFYWHLTPPAAAAFIAATTSLLNASAIPFQAKVLTDPNAYTRADAGVLYLRPGQDSQVGEILLEIHSAVGAWLRSSVPRFTRRIAPGLGYAEDPAGPLSFGQHRCRLVAEAVWDSHQQGEVDRHDRARALASAFRKWTLDPLRPHLEPGSRDDLPFGLSAREGALGAPRLTGPGRRSTAVAGSARHEQCSLMGAARQIGDTLCRTAYWDQTGRLCNWMGRSMTAERDWAGGPITPTSAALGPDLYAGTSGVALYLAQLFAMTREVEYRRTALAAIARSIRQLETPPGADVSPALSFFFGDLGVAWVARRVASLTAEARLSELADSIINRVVAATALPQRLDLMSGNAGAIPVLLELARDTGLERYRDLAGLLGEELCRAATREGTACFWDPDRASGPGMARAPMTGLAHGAAGIGLALFELHKATGRLEFLETARGAFEFEDSHFDPEHGNWRDLRSSSGPNDFARAWCHGAPGIALTRLRAATLDPDRAFDYTQRARIALDTTFDAIDINLAAPKSDACLCHGLAGLGEIALVAGQILDDSTNRSRASTLAAALIDRYGPSGDWPSGVPTRGPNPSLMLGLAGIGYWLLRLHAPQCVASVLFLGP